MNKKGLRITTFRNPDIFESSAHSAGFIRSADEINQ